MRKFRRSDAGISEVVGAMLLLIVTIVAVTTFGYYISTLQSQAQTRQSYINSVKNDDLKIQFLKLIGNQTSIRGINATIINLNTQQSGLIGVQVNGVALRNFSNDFYTYNSSIYLELPSRSFQTITLNVTSLHISRSNPLQIVLESVVGNFFIFNYANPTAVISENQYVEQSGVNTVDTPVFSSVNSLSTNGSLSTFHWIISNSTTGICRLNFSSVELPYTDVIKFCPIAFRPNGFNVTLTVEDTNGLTSNTTTPFSEDPHLV